MSSGRLGGPCFPPLSEEGRLVGAEEETVPCLGLGARPETRLPVFLTCDWKSCSLKRNRPTGSGINLSKVLKCSG